MRSTLKNSLLIFVVGAFGFFHHGMAQNENAWIDYNKTYFKLKVAEDGIYRISHEALTASGVPISSIDPRRIQLFHRGQEQAIFIEGQADGVFNTSDFIEFYGQKNDGTLDTRLYLESEAQPHAYHSLFSDSSAYFLTWFETSTAGKRRQQYTDNNINNLPAEDFHNREILLLQTAQYHEGRSYPPQNSIVLSEYDYGEGFTGEAFSRNQSRTFTLTGIVDGQPALGTPRLEILLAGRNNNAHQVEIQVGANTNALRTIGTAAWIQDDVNTFTSNLAWSDISATGELVVRTTARGVDGQADRVSVSYIKLTFPQAYDMNSGSLVKFDLENSSNGNSYLEIANAPTGTRLFDIRDPHNVIRIGATLAGNQLRAMVRNTNQGAKILAASTVNDVQRLEQVNFTNLEGEYDFMIISHPDLRSGANVSGDPVAAYADYRRSPAGGGYSVLDINIEEVFDQFAYGIPSSIAIKNMVTHFVRQNEEQFLFLIGKGISVNYNYYRRNPETTSLINYVPTFGYPGADALFSTSLFDGPYNSSIPVGRLNAKNAADVQNYLDKVIEMEAQPYDALWRKDIIHLSGGANLSEQARFRQYVDAFENIAEGKYLGADVVTETKQTTQAVEFFNITEEVNSGKALITFFGHSGSFATDIDIGFVTNPAFGYDNKGRYPIILVNGCNAGDLFSDAIPFGEDWIAAKDKGALGFMAHSKQAFSSNLRDYTEQFYATAFADESFFGQTLGKIKTEVGRRYFEQNGTNPEHITQVNQFVLLGDPAIKVFDATLPDYTIDELSVGVSAFEDEQVTSKLDSFKLEIPVINFAKFDEAPLTIRVSRTLGNGTVIDYPLRTFPAVLREDILEFTITNDPENDNEGVNSFSITIDPQNGINELDETNNSVTVDFVISGGSTTNIFPADLGVLQSQTVRFIVQASDLSSNESRGFFMEYDSVPDFSSGFRRNFTQQATGLATFEVDFSALQDTTTIYWRTRFTDPKPGESADPVASSFSWIPGINSGWAIQHPGQYDDLQVDGLSFNENTREWTFESIIKNLSVITHGANAQGRSIGDIEVLLSGLNYMVNSSPLDPFCRDNTLNMMGFDRQSAIPYKVLDLGGADVLNDRVCGRIPQVVYNFRLNDIYNSGQSGGGPRFLNQFVDNLGEAEYVLIFTIGSMNFGAFDNQVINALEDVGIARSTINSLSPGEPLIALGRKGGTPGSAIVVTDNGSALPQDQQVVFLDESVEGQNNSGTITSPLIGPVNRWRQYYADINHQNEEDYTVSIFGVRPNGTESLLTQLTDAAFNIGFINADNFPFLRLRMDIPASDLLVPPQFDHWVIDYEASPEGILMRKDNASRKNVQQGEVAVVEFTYWNISTSDYTDSLEVVATQINSATRAVAETIFNVAPPTAGDSITIQVPINTENGNGAQILNVSATPRSDIERIIGNNQVSLVNYLFIGSDNTNPILDVSFDGSYIMDGDIVSPNPRITILVKDFNTLVQKTDTAGVNIFLKEPCETCIYERVSLGGSDINWTPASENEDFRVEYQPQNLEDGVYGLRVQATDGTGNPSGVEPYEINFEVVNESTISHFYPYPNPFSSSTRFVFTLTGSVVPDRMKIQIMTINGRVVREITQDEIGTIKVGNNITEYAWNGTDEFGDQLANGVYLYRVVFPESQNGLDHRVTFGDSAFKDGYGKLYILR